MIGAQCLKKYNMDNKIILLCGSTASGKTNLSLKLADFFPIEIISVDSALIYKDLNIGSAKPTQLELQQVPHHLIDIIPPTENYSVMQFLTDCNNAIKDIVSRNTLPVLVGGTMMYYNAMLKGISQLPAADDELRASLNLDFEKFGNQVMYEKLQQLDQDAANKISPNDTQRLQRALEVCILTGKPMSVAQQEYKIPPLIDSFNPLLIALMPEDRKVMHERINYRYDKMVADGLTNEVKLLRDKYPQLTKEHNSMRCVGYRQAWEYLDGDLTYGEFIESGKAATRQLAKRQITWLRSLTEFNRFDSSKFTEDELFNYVRDKVSLFL